MLDEIDTFSCSRDAACYGVLAHHEFNGFYSAGIVLLCFTKDLTLQSQVHHILIGAGSRVYTPTHSYRSGWHPLFVRKVGFIIQGTISTSMMMCSSECGSLTPKQTMSVMDRLLRTPCHGPSRCAKVLENMDLLRLLQLPHAPWAAWKQRSDARSGTWMHRPIDRTRTFIAPEGRQASRPQVSTDVPPKVWRMIS